MNEISHQFFNQNLPNCFFGPLNMVGEVNIMYHEILPAPLIFILGYFLLIMKTIIRNTSLNLEITFLTPIQVSTLQMIYI